MASPQDLPAENGASPLEETVSPSRGGHLVTDYTPFHLDSDLTVVSDLKNELEIEETVLNEGATMNCSEQIVVEGEENQVEFWDRKASDIKSKVSSRRLSHAVDSRAEDWDNSSSDEDMGNYFNFSRTTVTCKTSRDSSQAPASSSMRSISQLDGVDDGTDSDASVTNSNTQNLKNPSQKPSQSVDVQHHKQWAGNGLCVNLPSPVFDSSSISSQLQHPAKHLGSLSSVGTVHQKSSGQTHSNDIPQVTKGAAEINVPRSSQSCTKSGLQDSQNIGFIGQTFKSTSQETLSDCVVPKETDPIYSAFTDDFQAPSLGTDSKIPMVLERCEPPSPNASFTELVPVQEDTQADTLGTTGLNEIYLDHNSGHFVSSTDGSTIFPNDVSGGTPEPTVTNPVNGNQDQALEPSSRSTETASSTSSVQSLQSSSSVQPSLVSITNSSNTSIHPVQNPEGKTVLPPVESFRTKLLSPSDTTRHAPSVPSGTMPYVSADLPPQSESVLVTPSGTAVSLATLGAVFGTVSTPVYSAYTQPVGSATVSIVPAAIPQPSTNCQPVPSIIQPASGPVVVNGYSSMPLQRETVSGRTISINFSTPRQTLEPQQQVTQALPGHAILTVKEVGGPNVDPTPHVLLVNRLGQIFVKNPESNTFQLPSPNSPSYNCVTQIASLLQSNALSATLAAAGNLTAVAGATMPAQVTRMVTPVVPKSETITQLLTSNSNGTAVPQEVKSKQDVSANGNVAEKKPQKKKEAPRKTKSTTTPGSSSKAADNHASSAQAIINQAMASYYDPNRSGTHILSPSSPRNPNVGGRAQSLSSVVLPLGLLVEPESTCSSAATPHSASSRPKQVRMKRVSSFSDRFATKKSKPDFLEPELSSGPEDQRKLSSAAR